MRARVRCAVRFSISIVTGAFFFCCCVRVCAQSDAEQAIKLNSSYAKAHHRLGVAKLGLGHYQDALPHFRRVCVLEPQDAGARNKLKEVVDLAKKVAFEEAIRFEEPSPFDNFDYEAIRKSCIFLFEPFYRFQFWIKILYSH